MNKKAFALIGLLILSISILVSCNKLLPSLPAEDEVLDGPVAGLSGSQLSQHIAGDIAFTDQVFSTETGLGPIFVATSCGSCHAGEGKGTPFTTLTRYGQIDSTGNQFLYLGGPQLQNRALPGFIPEQIPAGATHSRFMPPANTGLGLLEAVSDNDILAIADPLDLDGDGISGVPNWNFIPPYITPPANAATIGGKYICRFGKKASVFNLLQQTVNAYNQDIGITSVFEPKDVFSGIDIDPEISTQTVNDVVFYLKTLKAPVQRTPNDLSVMEGKIIFMQADCGNCHKPTLMTGFSPIDAISYKEFHPYTDLLLHNMGPGLNDGYTEGNALISEWRTAPLWGLGLSPKSQGGQYLLLHDGRATSIEQAIMLHGGEATVSKNKFTQLTNSDRDKLLNFLKSL